MTPMPYANVSYTEFHLMHYIVVYTRSQPDTSEPMIVLKILQFPSMLQLHTRVRAILWSVSSTVSSPHGMWPFDIDCNHKWRIIIREGVPHNVLNFRNVYAMCVCVTLAFASQISSALIYLVYTVAYYSTQYIVSVCCVQGGGEEGGGGQEKPKNEKRLKNQFNFSERASQTFNNPARVHTCVMIVYMSLYTLYSYFMGEETSCWKRLWHKHH